jgi:hypothetical protein
MSRRALGRVDTSLSFDADLRPLHALRNLAGGLWIGGLGFPPVNSTLFNTTLRDLTGLEGLAVLGFCRSIRLPSW